MADVFNWAGFPDFSDDHKGDTTKLRSLDAEIERVRFSLLHRAGWRRTIMGNSTGLVCWTKTVDDHRYVAMEMATAIRIEQCLQKGGKPLLKEI